MLVGRILPVLLGLLGSVPAQDTRGGTTATATNLVYSSQRTGTLDWIGTAVRTENSSGKMMANWRNYYNQTYNILNNLYTYTAVRLIILKLVY